MFLFLFLIILILFILYCFVKKGGKSSKEPSNLREFLKQNCVNSKVYSQEYFELFKEFPDLVFLKEPQNYCLIIGDKKLAQKYCSPSFFDLEKNKDFTGEFPLKPFKQKEREVIQISEFNPPIIISDYKIKSNPDFVVKIFRDDVLTAGSKQRGAICYAEKLLKNSKSKGIVYAGPTNGAAQIVIGVIANFFKIKAFMITDIYETEMKKRALKLGVQYQTFNLPLKEIQIKAQEFAKKNNYILLPFGLDDERFSDCLISAMKTVVKDREKIKRLWCVIGSGTLLKVFYEVFPNAFICGVQVGKKIFYDQIEEERTRVFIAPERFFEEAVDKPPYPSVINYDAKLWRFVKKYGKKGDYIWNVA